VGNQRSGARYVPELAHVGEIRQFGGHVAEEFIHASDGKGMVGRDEVPYIQTVLLGFGRPDAPSFEAQHLVTAGSECRFDLFIGAATRRLDGSATSLNLPVQEVVVIPDLLLLADEVAHDLGGRSVDGFRRRHEIGAQLRLQFQVKNRFFGHGEAS